MHIANYR
jgi:hypothetical protein